MSSTTTSFGNRKGGKDCGTFQREDTNVQDLSAMVSALNQTQRFAVLLHNILTPQECHALIQRSEEEGYERALIHVGDGQEIVAADIRKSDRCIMDDPDYAEMVYQRILLKLQDHPQLLGPMVNRKNRNSNYAVGLNERLRILRYDSGCYFKPHRDGYYVRSYEAGPNRLGEISGMSLLLYLNECYLGGNTRMFHVGEQNSGEGCDIVTRTGSVLLFEHECLHEGATLEKGRKYVVRTDLMYTDRGPGYEYSKGLYRG
jgi:hypothetical protein